MTISSNSGPKLSRLHRRHGEPTHTSRNAIQSGCLNSSLKILTESEEPNMDSFPLHRLEFKAMIPSLFGIQRRRKKPGKIKRGSSLMHTAVSRGFHSQESSDKVSFESDQLTKKHRSTEGKLGWCICAPCFKFVL